MVKNTDTPSTAVAEVKNTAVALPEGIDADALALMEGDDVRDDFRMQDVSLPFIQILQSLSKQVQKGEAIYIKGAEVGQFCNTATEQLWDGEAGVWAIPVKFQVRVTEWIPRSKGGGLVHDYGSDESVLADVEFNEATGKDTLANGNEVITTNTFYVLLVDVETGEIVSRGVIGMQGTQFKKGKKWNTMIEQFTLPRPGGTGRFRPPMYARAYKLTAVPERNDKGNWMGFKIGDALNTLALPQGKDLYAVAKLFRESIDRGDVKVAEPDADGGAASGGSNGRTIQDDEEIPF